MILVCGIPSEPPLALLLARAEAAGIPHLVLSQRRCADWDITLACDGGPHGTLHHAGRDWPLEDFKGVYSRFIEVDQLPEYEHLGRREEVVARARAEYFHSLLGDWLEIAPCRVVNRARHMASNVSKPDQARRIARTGLRIPETLVSGDPEEVRAFVERHGCAIYKSISSVRSIVREISPTSKEWASLDRVRGLPTQFQEKIAGVDVRVHVVGERWFATRVRSEAVDYRYGTRDGHEVEMSPFDLPPEIAARCIAVSRELGLAFCGIDLRLTPEGEYVCFEANPSPAYSFYEESTGQPISEALLHYLAGGPREDSCFSRGEDTGWFKPSRIALTSRAG